MKKQKNFSHPLKRMSKRSFRGNGYNQLYFSTRDVAFGATAVLFSTEFGTLTKQQLESARKIIRKKISKKGKFVIKAFSYIPVTKKPNEVRMGKGKGKIENHMSFVFPGKPIFELSRIAFSTSLNALKSAQSKLPFSSKVVIILQ